ncbi:hypothetical protein MMC10_003684 [Thelotrema lepadinum]|nr:hypothetical protein [Thelotrema lepadinum]
MAGLEGKTFGFIGLGAMGTPMVQNLAEKLPTGIKIYVFDVVEKAVDGLCSQCPNRVLKTQSAREVAEKSDIVLTMVPEGSHVRSVYLNRDKGILSTDISTKLLIDCSTIDTATSLLIKDHITSASATSSFYDAPVSGGVIGAQKGTLAFFLGCAPSDPNLPLLTTILELMGKTPIPCGGPSLGLAAKLSNNYLSGVIAIATSEAMDMGMRSGLDPRVLARVYAAGTAQNAICDRFCPVPGVVAEAPSSSGYRGGFKVQLMRRDFGLAVEMAERVGTQLALGKVGLETYEGASEDERCRDLDSRVVFRYFGGK